MPGVLVEISAEAGAVVALGEPVAVVEAMKMRHRVAAPAAGKITSIAARAGDQLARGDLILEIEAEA